MIFVDLHFIRFSLHFLNNVYLFKMSSFFFFFFKNLKKRKQFLSFYLCSIGQIHDATLDSCTCSTGFHHESLEPENNSCCIKKKWNSCLKYKNIPADQSFFFVFFFFSKLAND